MSKGLSKNQVALLKQLAAEPYAGMYQPTQWYYQDRSNGYRSLKSLQSRGLIHLPVHGCDISTNAIRPRAVPSLTHAGIEMAKGMGFAVCEEAQRIAVIYARP